MKQPINHIFKIRPRYGEVDEMGYVYHANYVSYCHQARTELLRQLGISDKKLDSDNILLPVISMNLRYLKPAGYDELLTIRTDIPQMPTTRFLFQFEGCNEDGILIFTANSTLAFVDKYTRKPMKIPRIIEDALQELFKAEINENHDPY